VEELNKNQIILLTLLISFITSIATGIVTVTLMDQAPQGVTGPITRVVERTVERIVPGEKEVIREVPIIVTEEDLIVQTIDRATPAVFRLVEKVDGSDKRIGSAFIIDTGGLLVTDAKILGNGQGSYSIVTDDGKNFAVDVVKGAGGKEGALLKIKDAVLEDFSELIKDISPLEVTAKEITVGQTVVAVGATGGGNLAASVSIISSISEVEDGSSELMMLRTNAATPDNIGGPLLDIHGQVTGINTASGFALPAKSVRVLLDGIN
jgi:S1-C subfamily serine protease